MEDIDEKEPELLNQISKGNTQAFTRFYHHRRPRVKWFASAITKGYPYDLDDLSQEVFLSVWERKMMLPTVVSVDGYLFITVRNILACSRRQQKIREKVYNNYGAGQQAWYNDTESNALQKFLKEAATRAIGALPEKRREVFRLSVYCGMSHKDIAGLLAISTQRVGQQLAQAKVELTAYLEKNADWIVYAGVLLMMLWMFGGF